MSSPKFKVGEIVIRQAPRTNYPEANGEYIVTQVITKEDYQKIYPDFAATGRFYYRLNDFEVRGSKTGTPNYHSSETFLFKKHKPSELGFNELMSSLNSPITREQLIENKS